MDQRSQFSIRLPQARSVSAKLSSVLSMPHISSVHRQAARIERVVKNATNSKTCDISDKHLAEVANYIQENYNCASELTILYARLITRLCKKTDLASIKSHYLFHSNIFSDTGIHPAYRYSSWNIFIDKYVILPNLETGYQYSVKQEASPLVVAYNRYLNQRLLDYARLKSDIVREERYFRKNSASTRNTPESHMVRTAETQMVRTAEASLCQIRLILDCMFPSDFSDQSLLLSIYNLLAVDLSILFSVVCECFVALLQNFSALIRTDAERTLFLYKEFSQLQIPQEVRIFAEMAPNMANSQNIRLPTELNQDAEHIRALIKSLELYLYQDLRFALPVATTTASNSTASAKLSPPPLATTTASNKLSPPPSPFSSVSGTANGTPELVYGNSPTLSSMSSPLMIEKFDDSWASDILSEIETTPDTSLASNSLASTSDTSTSLAFTSLGSTSLASTSDTSSPSIEPRKNFVLAPPPRRRKRIPGQNVISNHPWVNFDFT